MPRRNALDVVHRILIGAAVALSAILLIHGAALYRARGDSRALLTGLVAAAVGVGLSVYLARLSRK